MTRRKAWKTRTALIALLVGLLASAVVPTLGHGMFQSGGHAAAYSDPIATGNAQQDQYDTIIMSQAQAFGLNPFIIKGQIMLESAFNPSAVSPWGDLGLMQLKPYTFAAMGYSGGWSGMFDPWTNIHYGTMELAQLANQFGSVSLGLQAYNIGSTSVENGGRNWQYANLVMSYASEFESAHNSAYGWTSSTVQIQTNVATQQQGSGSRSVSSSSSNGGTTYNVQPGDTLYAIGQRYGISWQSIAQLNGVQGPNYYIYVGHSLNLP